MKLLDSLVTEAASIVAIRRDIHAHPELCFHEERTADLVAAKLTEWGIPIHRGLGTTGVVGIIKNGTLYVQAAAGVVADSVPELEWKETEHKARALLRAAELVEEGLE